MRALLVTALAAIVITIAGVPMFLHPPTAHTGVRLHFTGAWIQPNIIDVESNSSAYRAGLRSGDIISCLSVRDSGLLIAWADPRAYRPGAPIDLCVKRGDAWQPVRFIADPGPSTGYLYGNDAMAMLRIAGYAVFVAFAMVLVLGRPGRATWTFFAYALVAAPNIAIEQNLAALNPSVYALLYNASMVALTIQYGLLMQFAALVPDDRPPGGWRNVLYRVAIGVTAFLFLFGITRCITSFVVTPGPLRAVTAAAAALVFLTVAARLIGMQREERGRFGWAAFAILWAVTIDFLRQDATLLLPTQGTSLAALLLVVTPLVLMYAILKRHVIDISFAISRTLVYAVVTTIVVLTIGAVDWLTSTYLHQARVALALDALVTIGVAFALHRLLRAIESAVDFLLFRHKYDAETYLNRLGRTLISATQEETIDRALVRDPFARLHLSMAALFRKTGASFVLSSESGYDAPPIVAFDSEHDLVRFLCVENASVRLGDLTQNPFGHASVAVPIRQGPDVTAFVVYGIHRDGTALDPDELETLERLCDAAAQAYTYMEVSRYRAEVSRLSVG